MIQFLQSRYKILNGLAFCFLLPLLAMNAYGFFALQPRQSWKLFNTGLFFGIVGILGMTFLMFCWEKAIRRFYSQEPLHDEPVDTEEKLDEAFLHQAHENQEALTEVKEELAALIDELKEKNEELEYLKENKDDFDRQKEDQLNALSEKKDYIEDQLKQKDILIEEYQHTISDQRAVIEKKQKQIEQFESKVNDLTYEIKTLIQLADTEGPSKTTEAPPNLPREPLSNTKSQDKVVSKPEDPSALLKRCLNIAQKLTGSAPFTGNSSRFPGFPNFALDQRRLFDSLQSESSNAIIIYSQKDKKLLFANDKVRELLGWTPDKFLQGFDDLIQDGLSDWKSRVSHISPKEENDIRLIVKAKSGEDILVHCHIGLIPTGVFRNHVIGILCQG